MDYEYAVFISYRRNRLYDPWARDIFRPLLEARLQALAIHPARVFLDSTDIRSGQEWTTRVAHALCHSRCLVALWTPDYFRSDPCLWELTTMLTRERAHGFQTSSNPLGLVVPIRCCDGQNYPKAVQGRQQLDFRRYYLAGNFRNRSLYFSLQQELNDWVETTLAEVIAATPAWQDSWYDPVPAIPDELRLSGPVYSAPLLGL
jgi:hypothetical protein